MSYALQHEELEIIEDKVEHGSQSWTRTTTVRWRGHKVRAVISRDSYDRQSSIHVDVFSAPALQWNRLRSDEGNTHSGLVNAYTKDDEAILQGSWALRDELLAYAQEILNGVPA